MKSSLNPVKTSAAPSLVKEMRLAGICTMDKANEFLTEYLSIQNEKFSVEVDSSENGHVLLDDPPTEEDFYIEKETRRLSRALSFQYENKEYQLVNLPSVRQLQHQSVEVVKLLTGKLRVRLQDGRFLAFEEVRVWSISRQRTLDERQAAVVSLGSKRRKPGKHHPWR